MENKEVKKELDFETIKKSRNIGFAKEIGMKTVELKPGYCKIELELTAMHKNPIGTIHGGVIFSICDSCGGGAATAYGSYVTTVNALINYLRPTMNSKKLIAEATERKSGKNISVYDITVTDDTGTVVSSATFTYARLKDIPQNANLYKYYKKEEK